MQLIGTDQNQPMIVEHGRQLTDRSFVNCHSVDIFGAQLIMSRPDIAVSGKSFFIIFYTTLTSAYQSFHLHQNKKIMDSLFRMSH